MHAAWSVASRLHASLFKPDFDNAAAFQLQNPALGRRLSKASFIPAGTRSNASFLGRIAVQPFWQLPRHLFLLYFPSLLLITIFPPAFHHRISHCAETGRFRSRISYRAVILSFSFLKPTRSVSRWSRKSAADGITRADSSLHLRASCPRSESDSNDHQATEADHHHITQATQKSRITNETTA